VVERPGQRQSISAASAVNARGGFWYCTYQDGLNAESFVSLLRRMMRRRSKPVHLVLDGAPSAQDHTGEDLCCLHAGHADAAFSSRLRA
jgi:DDE superfamily endonuclease